MKFVRCMPEEQAENKMFIYGVLNSRKGSKMSDIDPTWVVRAKGFIMGRDDATDKDLLAVITENGEVFYTVSKVFISQFIDCVDTLETSNLSFKVGRAKNKSGREYITFDLVY